MGGGGTASFPGNVVLGDDPGDDIYFQGTLRNGLRFPGVSVPSSNPNILDDYEEGVFTPTIGFVTAGDLAVTYSKQIATYTKIGRMVNFSIDLITATFTYTTATGAFFASTLPFTPLSAQGDISCNASLATWTKAGYTTIDAYTAPGSGRVFFNSTGSGVPLITVDTTFLPSGTTVRLKVSGYFLAT